MTNHPQLLFMQEKDLVDADTSQSLYKLHMYKVVPTIFLRTNKSKHVSTQLRGQLTTRVELSYGATMYNRAELPAWS